MLLEETLSWIRRYSLVPEGSNVLVGLSGGRDSVALLCCFLGLRGELSCSLRAAHLNHLLRGEESEEDERFVVRLCEELGVPLEVGRVDVAGLARERGVGLEEAARAERYRFLERVARRLDCPLVAVGHTATDLVETMLMRLARGCSPDSLAGMRPARPIASGSPVTLIRPLLGVSRAEVERYLVSIGRSWRDDSTNESDAFRRNLVRSRVLPPLRKLNPSLERAALALAQALWRDADHFAPAVQAVLERAARGERILLGELLSPGEAVAARALARILRDACSRQPSAKHIARVLSLGDGERATLPGGLLVRREGNELLLGERPVPSFEAVLPVPGEVVLPEAGWRLRAEFVPEAPREWSGVPPTTLYADADRLSLPLTVRSRRRGDRFRPLGAGGGKTVSDFLTDAGISWEERRRLAVVVSGGQIVWLVGLRPDDRFKVCPSTRRVLRIEAERI